MCSGPWDQAHMVVVRTAEDSWSSERSLSLEKVPQVLGNGLRRAQVLPQEVWWDVNHP